MLCGIEVLESIKASNEKPVEAFAVSKQYKSARNADDEEGAVDEEPVKVNKKKKKKGKKPKKMRVQIREDQKAEPKASGKKREQMYGEYKPESYKKARVDFIKERRDQGDSFKDASDAWNESSMKAQLLCQMPVAELVRRRFVEKGTTSNPWAA